MRLAAEEELDTTQMPACTVLRQGRRCGSCVQLAIPQMSGGSLLVPLEHAAHGARSHRAIEELRREARLHDVPLAWPSFTSPSWVEGNTACNNVSLSCTGTS